MKCQSLARFLPHFLLSPFLILSPPTPVHISLLFSSSPVFTAVTYSQSDQYIPSIHCAFPSTAKSFLYTRDWRVGLFLLVLDLDSGSAPGKYFVLLLLLFLYFGASVSLPLLPKLGPPDRETVRLFS